ncbi:hypothetical protein V1264_019318 [Littorina saxatilis]|uniref:BAH domain-containing protein n=1 Tax=Littorina saxatilis TaxID=31220 RepID=A0AAN9BGC4_9CAEN
MFSRAYILPLKLYHFPLQKKKTYKSTHSIGSRKATEKVVTYSESLPCFSEMVQQYLNDRDMEPKKASPAKTPSAKSSPTKTTPTKPSPAKSPKASPGKSSSAKASPSAKTTSAKSSQNKASQAKPKSTGKSPRSKPPGKSSGSAQPPVKSTNVKPSPKATAKRKNSNDAATTDTPPTKKQKLDIGEKSAAQRKTTKSGKNDSKNDVAEKLKQISARAEKDEPKKKRADAAKKTASDKGKKRADENSKDKKSPSSKGGKKPAQKNTKPVKTKAPKKKEDKEIPSLLSFIKPKREASMNASARMDIMFEKFVSPKKSPSKASLASSSPNKTPTNKVEGGTSVSAKKKLVFVKAGSKSSKAKKASKSSESQSKKPNKTSKTKSKGSSKKIKSELNKAANGKVVKRKCKKRMASLNARALIVAERESMQQVLERAARTDRYCVSWIRHKPPTAHSPNRTLRWVDGLGGCGVCNSKKDLPDTGGACVTEISATAHPSPESKHPVSALPTPPISHDGKDHLSDDRPSSVVDVVSAHTPHLDPVTHQPAVVDIVNTHSPVKAQVLGGSFNNFGGLYPHSSPCMAPCPGYSYSHTEGYVTTQSYQSFSFSGIGTLNAVPLVTPTFRPSAFSVPGYNVNVPYGYYPGAPYYQPAPTPIIQGPLPKPCMVPHPLSFKFPQGPVKVLIHNPDTPEDHAAFSEYRPPEKGNPSEVTNIMRKVSNDSNNNNNGSMCNSSLSKTNGALNHSSQTANSKRGLDKAAEKQGSQSEGSKKPSDPKKKDADHKKKDVSGSKNAKTCESNSKKKSVEASKRRDGDGGKKKDSKVVLKAKESKDSKESKVTAKQPKKKSEKRKGGEKGSAGEETEANEESIPEHGWVWVGEPESKKVVSVHFDQPAEERVSYKAIRHSTHGDVIRVRDCVLLRSGGCRSDVPYVAKVGAFWELPKTKEKMMSLLWYYQPEHTEAGRQPHDMENEVFASRHRDENSVACIDDKCYVLTYDQFCRYQAQIRRVDHHAIPRPRIVPDLDWSSPEVDYPQQELPSEEVDPATVFCCRRVFDFRMKRILKNPS